MAKRPKDAPQHEPPVDLASRIGARHAAEPVPTASPQPPVDAAHPLGAAHPPRLDGPLPSSRDRQPLGPGEIDVVATPIPTLDDCHRFEIALRRVRGVGEVRTEYHRHGVLKMRVSYEGAGRLAHALRDGMPGYQVRVIGEDRTTLQIVVSSDGDERRPG